MVNRLTAFVPRMLAHGEPCRVVNTASMAAFGPTDRCRPTWRRSRPVLGLTESLAIELEGTNVAVSVVCPGAVDTEIAQSERNRQQRYGAPSGRCMPIGPEQEKAALQLIHPDEAGRRIVARVEGGEFWIFTHPEWCRRLPSRSPMPTLPPCEPSVVSDTDEVGVLRHPHCGSSGARRGS